MLGSDRLVDLAQQQIFIKLLDVGIYLGSVSPSYRALAENRQVQEHRRLATHPRAISELEATAPNQVLTLYADNGDRSATTRKSPRWPH